MSSKLERAMFGTLNFPKGFGSTVKFKELDLQGKSVAGFDTEADAITAQPYLLTYADPERKGHISLVNPTKTLDFLSTHRYRDTINFFFNLQYDFEGMSKLFPKDFALAMYGDGRAYLDEQGNIIDDENNYVYRMSYIQKKAFHLKVNGQKKYSYFDAFQYFQSGLDSAARKYLGVGKEKGFEGKYSSKQLFEGRSTIDEEINRFTEHYQEEFIDRPARLKEEVAKMEAFFHQFSNAQAYREKLLEYAVIDAERCRQLGEIIVKGINNFVNTRNFNSSASISEYYFRSHEIHIPKLTQEIFRKFMATYYGGRFEITRKGVVPDVSMFDIKSAYPYAMTELPILSKNPITKTVWNKTERALFGAYQINAVIPPEYYISPLPIRNGLVKFPSGRFEKYWVDKVTLELLEEIGIKYHVLKGIEIYDEQADYRLRELVLKLFAIKEDKSNPEVVRQAAKIILNSLYGKFMQLVDDTVLEEVEELEELDSIGPQGLFTIGQKMFARVHNEVFNTGKMFAPQYGAFITAHTRALIYRNAMKIGLENIIGIHTDSLMIDGKYSLPESKEIGGFELEVLKQVDEESGEVLKKVPMRNVKVMLQKCGMYEAEKDGAIKIKARGVGKAKTLMQTEFEVIRRHGLKTAVKRDFDKMNVISSTTIKNDLNSDRKRTWAREISLEDIRNEQTINSTTLNGVWTTNVPFN